MKVVYALNPVTYIYVLYVHTHGLQLIMHAFPGVKSYSYNLSIKPIV